MTSEEIIRSKFNELREFEVALKKILALTYSQPKQQKMVGQMLSNCCIFSVLCQTTARIVRLAVPLVNEPLANEPFVNKGPTVVQRFAAQLRYKLKRSIRQPLSNQLPILPFPQTFNDMPKIFASLFLVWLFWWQKTLKFQKFSINIISVYRHLKQTLY